MLKALKSRKSCIPSLFIKKSWAACALVLLLGAGIFLPASFCFAAELTWTGATSGDWADATNWNTSTVPTASDNVTIPDAGTTANDPSISAGATCNNLTIAAAGVLSGNAQTITVNGNWTNQGAFNHGGGMVAFVGGDNNTFTPGSSVYNDISLNKTNLNNFRLTISGTATVAGDLTQTRGAFFGGQIDLAGVYTIGTSARQPYMGSASVVNFNHASNDQGIIYNTGGVGAHIRIDKPGGTFSINSDITVSGWEYVQGAVSGVDSRVITLGGEHNDTFVPGGLTYRGIGINKTDPNNYYVTISGAATVSGNVIQTDGAFYGQINLSGNYVIGAAANGGTGTVNFNHISDNQSIAYSAGGVGAHVRIDKPGGTFSINSDITVSGWEYVQGAVSGVDSRVITLGGGFSDTFTPGGLTYFGLVINKNSGNASYDDLMVGLGGLNISGSLTVTDGELKFNTNNNIVNISGDAAIAAAGALYAGTNPITLHGNWTNAGTFSHGSGKLVFAGAGGASTLTPGASAYYDIELNKTNDASDLGTLYVAATTTVSHDFLQTDGELGSGQLDVAGDYTIGAGAGGVTAGYAAKVNLNGAGAQAISYASGGIGAKVRIDKVSGTLTVSSDLTVTGWEYIQGAVTGTDSHTFTFGDNASGAFIPGNLTYGNIVLDKTFNDSDYDYLAVSGVALVAGSFTHNDGTTQGGQLDVAGDYIINAPSLGGERGYAALIVNLNGPGDQAIVCAAGGVGDHVRVDKASGTLTIGGAIALNSWTYVRGTVAGIGSSVLSFEDDTYGTFVPGELGYGGITVNKNVHSATWDQVTVGAGTLAIAGNLSVAEGQLLCDANNNTFNVSGNVTIGALGTLSAGSNPITVRGNWTNAGTFHHGSGKIIFAGTANATFTPGASGYYDLEINKTNSDWDYDHVSVSGTASVAGSLTHANGRMLYGQIDLGGDYVITANACDGRGGMTATVVNFNHAAADQSLSYTAGGAGAQVRVDKAGGNLNIASDITVSGWTYVQGSVVGLDVYSLTLGGNANGSFVPGGMTYGDLIINKTSSDGDYDHVLVSGTASVAGNLTHTNGRMLGGKIDLAGDYAIGASASGSYRSAYATVVNFNHATNNQQVSYAAGGVGAELRIDKVGGTFTVGSNLTLSGWTYVRGGVSGVGGGTLTFGGFGKANFVPGSLIYGSIVFNNTISDTDYDDLYVGSGTLNISGNLTVTDGQLHLETNTPTVSVSGSVSIAAAATVNAGSNPITVNGNWTNAGAFNHGNGTLAMRGNGLTTFTPGSSSYYNFQLNKTNRLNTNDDLSVAGTATVLHDVLHTAGDFQDGQIDLHGDYLIAAGADGASRNYSTYGTVINMCGAGAQAISFSAGGIGSHVKVNKTSGTLTISSDLVVNDWTYVQGTVVGMDAHTLILGGDTFGSFTPGSLVYGDVEENKTNSYLNYGWNNLVISGTATIAGDFLRTAGRARGGQLNVAGDYTIGAAAEGCVRDYTAVSTVINLNGAGDQSIFYNAGGEGDHVRIDKTSGTVNIPSDLVVNSWTYVRGAVSDLTGRTLTFADTRPAVFNPGTLVYGNIVINREDHNSDYDQLTLGSGTLKVSGDLTLTTGKLLMNSNNPSLSVGGDLAIGAVSATFTKGSGTLTFDGTSPALFTDLSASPQNIGKVIVDKSNADPNQNTLTLAANMTVDTLTVNVDNAFLLGAGGRVLTLANAGALATVLTLDGALTAGDGTVRYAATNSAGSINVADMAYRALELSGAETYALMADTVIGGNLTIGASATLDTATFDLTLAGDLANSGVFTANSNQVTLDGVDQTLSGNTTFYDLTKTVSASDTLTFATGSATSVGHNLTLRGGDRTSRLALRSSATDTAWGLDVADDATLDLDSLDVQDSDASTGQHLSVLNSLDSGNNLNWTLVNNTAPALSVPAVAASGNIAVITATASDIDADNLSLKVEYSLDGGNTWLDPYLTAASASSGTPLVDNAAAYQLSGISTASNNTLTLSWDTASLDNQAGRIEYATQLRIRLTPFDGTDQGAAQVSSVFTVDNRPSSFIVPQKPNLSGLEITNAEGRLNFNNLPASVTQVAVSSSPDFTNASFEDLSLLDVSGYTDTLYLKFRTKGGAVSDPVSFEPASGVVTTLLGEGDIAKAPDSPDVYIIKYKNGKQYKRLILSPSVFASYGHLKWDNLKMVSQTQLDSYTTSSLVQVAGDPALYELTPLGDTGRRRALAPTETYDPDSVYEINRVDRDSYAQE